MTNARLRRSRLRTDWARGQLVVVLAIPVADSVREVHAVHAGRAVRVLRARPVPTGEAGATLIRKRAF